MRLFNTMSRRVEEVHPHGGELSLYVCGITPYDVGHLGHMLTYLTYDVMRRRLELDGVRVRHIQNITDVDDDIIRKARELETSPEALTDRNVAIFERDMASLRALRPHAYPRVSETMPFIIELVGQLQREGYAYADGSDVYFDISRFPAFGALSRLTPEQMVAESRRQRMRPGPRNPLDFLLWQAKAAGEPAWDTPWGEGRPGWHIECTAMAIKGLGATVDIHGGGADLIYPHHECEIAQSEAVTGISPFVHIWAHIGMLHYQGEKMSKSLGNMVFASDLLRDYSADAIRLALFSQHYRTPWSFDDAVMRSASEHAHAISAAMMATNGQNAVLDIASAQSRLLAALDDDLNSPLACDVLVAAARTILQAAEQGSDVSDAQRTLRRMADVLGLTAGL